MKTRVRMLLWEDPEEVANYRRTMERLREQEQHCEQEVDSSEGRICFMDGRPCQYIDRRDCEHWLYRHALDLVQKNGRRY